MVFQSRVAVSCQHVPNSCRHSGEQLGFSKLYTLKSQIRPSLCKRTVQKLRHAAKRGGVVHDPGPCRPPSPVPSTHAQQVRHAALGYQEFGVCSAGKSCIVNCARTAELPKHDSIHFTSTQAGTQWRRALALLGQLTPHSLQQGA